MQSFFLSFILLCGLLGTSGAFPWAGEGIFYTALLRTLLLHPNSKQNNALSLDVASPLQERSRRDPLEGLLGTVATNVSEADRRPDASHPFVEPGPNDQRGACPGAPKLHPCPNHRV